MANLRTPLYDWHVAHKARMVPFGGWDMPVQYASIIEEHKAVRGGVGLFDISHMARVDLTGSNTLSLLESTFTNSVASMKVGQVRYGLVCNEEGGILDDILVYRWADSFSAVVNASNRNKILNWWHRLATGTNVKIDDRTLATTMIAVQGPKAVDVVVRLFADDVSKLKYYYAQQTSYRGTPCVVSRTGYTGEDGFEISLDNALGVQLWEELLARGAVACGLGARDTLRLEAAMPLYSHEMNETIDPVQAGLGWAVKLDKGDFIGRAAIQAKPADRLVRVGLELEGKRAARQDSLIVVNDRPVGTVCSGSYVPYLEKSIAMGYVSPKLAAIGTSLAVDLRGTKIPATVVPLPFYKRVKTDGTK